eukprot:6562267-Pyramimonas_sp.AAC.1
MSDGSPPCRVNTQPVDHEGEAFRVGPRVGPLLPPYYQHLRRLREPGNPAVVSIRGAMNSPVRAGHSLC